MKVYTITAVVEDGKVTLKRKNEGFSFIELLGIAGLIQQELLYLWKDDLYKPDVIVREAVVDKEGQPSPRPEELKEGYYWVLREAGETAWVIGRLDYYGVTGDIRRVSGRFTFSGDDFIYEYIPGKFPFKIGKPVSHE